MCMHWPSHIKRVLVPLNIKGAKCYWWRCKMMHVTNPHILAGFWCLSMWRELRVDGGIVELYT